MTLHHSEDAAKESQLYRGADLKLFVKDLTQGGMKRAVCVRSWATVKDVKDAIQAKMDVLCSRQRLYYGPLLSSGCELRNYRSLQDVGIYKSGETLLLDVKKQQHALGGHSSLSSFLRAPVRESHEVSISSSMIDSTPSALRHLIFLAARGIDRGIKPELVLDGSGGTYYMHDARKNRVAVFKPADEEPYAENNPRGYLQHPGGGLSLRQGIVPGEACIREVAAYLLDHRGFSDVPMTTLAEARHHAFNTNGSRLTVAAGGASIGWHSANPQSPVVSPLERKAGSFQEFVRCECTMDDLSPSKISTEEVHKIAILDIRLMNADRNSANLLCRRRRDNSLELVPIDHGYCLRSVCDVSWMDWCWLDWPHLKEPLSKESRHYILNLDIEADARMLHERLNICEQAIDNFRASSLLLKAGVKAGLSLYEIAVMCCRNDMVGEVPSRLEVLANMASEIAVRAVENDLFHHSAATRALQDQLTPQAGATLSRRERSSSRMHKSMSSAEFRSIGSKMNNNNTSIDGDDDEEELVDREDLCSPEMAQASTSSDSSSSGSSDNDDNDTCDEWAVSVLNDISIDQQPRFTRPQRSSSIFSDDGSTDSMGFWAKVAPGTSPPSLSDDGSGFWSPQLSPQTANGRDSIRTPPPDLTLPVPVGSPFGTGRARVSFTFADQEDTKQFIPPRTVNIENSSPTSINNDNKPKSTLFPSMVRTDSGMTRSKSYSALSSMSFDKPDSSVQQLQRNKKTPSSRLGKGLEENYRKVFLSFIDLMMVREATMAANQHNTAAA